jgi:hypothetical protein
MVPWIMGYPEVMLRNKLFDYAGQKSASRRSLLISSKPVWGHLRPKIFRERLFVRAMRHSCRSQDKLIHNFRESFVHNIAHKRLQNDIPAARMPPNRPAVPPLSQDHGVSL